MYESSFAINEIFHIYRDVSVIDDLYSEATRRFIQYRNTLLFIFIKLYKAICVLEIIYKPLSSKSL